MVKDITGNTKTKVLFDNLRELGNENTWKVLSAYLSDRHKLGHPV